MREGKKVGRRDSPSDSGSAWLDVADGATSPFLGTDCRETTPVTCTTPTLVGRK